MGFRGPLAHTPGRKARCRQGHQRVGRFGKKKEGTPPKISAGSVRCF